MDFDAELYDLEEERSSSRQNNIVVPNVHEAWVRRLGDVVRLDIRKVRRRNDSFGSPLRDHFNFGDVHLTFADGTEVDLNVDQLAMYDADDGTQADELIEAVRSHSGL